MALHDAVSGQYQCSVKTKIKLPLLVIKHHFINTYGAVEARRSTHFVILALDEVNGQLDSTAVLPSEEEPIWTLWRNKKSVAITWNRT
jgi:hypothetical protein